MTYEHKDHEHRCRCPTGWHKITEARCREVFGRGWLDAQMRMEQGQSVWLGRVEYRKRREGA